MSHEITSHVVTFRLLVIIACYALLVFATTRKWLRSFETTIVGLAIIFWATGWLLETLVSLTRSIYGVNTRALLLAAAMTFPVTLSLSVGLWILVRRMRKNATGASAPPSPPPRIRKNNKQ